MKAVIIEDEAINRDFLKSLIEQNFKDIEIVACLESVKRSIDFFSSNSVDLVFMDIQLSDGYCFSIFDKTDIQSMIIFTTAYDEYAIKAFEQNSIAYLLKPISKEKLDAAMQKFYKLTSVSSKSEAVNLQTEKLNLLLNAIASPAEHTFKNRFIIKQESQIIIVNETDIAYFISKNKICYLYTFDNKSYRINYTLDKVMEELNPKRFYKVSRTFVISLECIVRIDKSVGSRLKLEINPPYKDSDVFVSRESVKDFLAWIEQ